MRKPDECQRCPLWEETEEDFVQVERGNANGGVVFVGEAGGENEAKDALPFRYYAASGGLLDKATQALGMKRSDFTYLNTCNCRPPDNWLSGAPWEAGAIKACRPIRNKWIKEAKPGCIVTLGGIATNAITGVSLPITEIRGFPLTGLAPFKNVPVIPALHPSFFAHKRQKALILLISDIQRAVAISRGSDWKEDIEYTMLTKEKAKHFAEGLSRVRCELVAFDIEAAMEDEEDGEEVKKGDITQIQFSTIDGYAVAMPWERAYLPYIREILEDRTVTKVGHNSWRSDGPVLEANDVSIRGPHLDTMWMMHHLYPDLKGFYGLQATSSLFGMPFAWKHRMPYSKHQSHKPIHQWEEMLQDKRLAACADPDATLRSFNGIRASMKTLGIWDGFVQQVARMEPILQKMSKRGIKVDAEAQAELKGVLGDRQRQVYGKMQEVHPDELKLAQPTLGFVREPKEQEGLVKREFIINEHGEVVERWCRLKPFKPSKKQMMIYMKAQGWTMPRHKKTKKETTEQDALERIYKRTNDGLLEQVLEYRAVDKLKGTYIWKLGPDGRVHPEFTYWPANVQFSSRRPNSQNAPSTKTAVPWRRELAKAFRKTVTATQGHTLIKPDWRSFHAMTTGWCAGDEAYMRMSRLDMHSFFAAVGLLKLEKAEKLLAMPDEEYMEWVKWFRSDPEREAVRNVKAKPADLSIGFKSSPAGVYIRNEDSFENVAEVTALFNVLKGLFPKTFAWQRHIMEEAHERKYLISAHGHIRWFWEVFRKDWFGNARRLGEDAEDAVAYLPAADAYGHKREVLDRMEMEGLLDRYWLVNDEHDSLTFDCTNDLLDEAVPAIVKHMSIESSVMPGLAVMVDVKMGPNWADMREVKL